MSVLVNLRNSLTRSKEPLRMERLATEGWRIGQAEVHRNRPETDKRFDPKEVYSDAPNPTKL